MRVNLQSLYINLTVIALFATLYSLLVPGISKPILEPAQLKHFEKLGSSKFTGVSTKNLNKDSSDRKVSMLYQYKFVDGSSIIAARVRVRKRDDFKIEAYGLLTKDLSPIYIKSPQPTQTTLHSIHGFIDKKSSMQTCLVPGTTTLDEVDFRLNPLKATVERLNPSPKNLFTRLVGNENNHDYSCIVLTYQPSKSSSQSESIRMWNSIIETTQKSLNN